MDLGLLDTMFNKESKLLEKAKKELAKADSLEKNGHHQEALGELERTSAMLKENMLFIGKMKRDFAVIFSSLGARYLEFDKAQTANDAAKVAIQLDPKNPLGMKVQGLSAFKLGMRDDAISSLKSAAALSPESEDMWSSLAKVQAESGDKEGAAESYARALAINPLGITYIEAMLSQKPNDVDLVKKKASVLCKLQRYDEAAWVYEDGLRLTPMDKDLWIGRATALNLAGNGEEAADVLGRIQHKLGRRQEALKSFSRAADLDQENKVIWNELGVVQEELDQLDQALESFERARRIDPNDINILINKKKTLLKSAKYAEVLDTCDKIMLLNPLDQESMMDKARALFALERYDEAITLVDGALNLAPNSKDAMNLKKSSLIRLGKHADVVAWCSKMLEVDPNDFQALLDKGIASFGQRRLSTQ
jgi:tetratricopeptide (TPR) repeat protein